VSVLTGSHETLTLVRLGIHVQPLSQSIHDVCTLGLTTRTGKIHSVRSGEQSSHLHTFDAFIFWSNPEALCHFTFDTQLFGKCDSQRSSSNQHDPVEQRGWYCGRVICRQHKVIEDQRQSKVKDKPWSSNEFKEVIDAVWLGSVLWK
jgi:hypothetical protein